MELVTVIQAASAYGYWSTNQLTSVMLLYLLQMCINSLFEYNCMYVNAVKAIINSYCY